MRRISHYLSTDAGKQQFLHFPHDHFYPFNEKNGNISATLNLLSANAFNIDKAKDLSSGKGLSPLLPEHG